MNGPVLFTERLILRPLAAEDVDDWAAFCAEPETMRFLGGVQSRAAAWRSLCTIAGAWTIRGFSMFAVVERATGAWVGRVGPWQPEDWPGTEVGWDDVIHTIDPANHASIRLAERLGSVRRGSVALPDPLGHFQVEAWGQTAAAWRARRGITRGATPSR